MLPILLADLTTTFGQISPPPGVANYNSQSASGIGLVLFASTLIRIITIGAGIFVLVNFILAGFDYISAGDTTAHKKVREKLTMSILGLVIIVMSYTVVGVLSLILFGDAGYILSPTISGPGP